MVHYSLETRRDSLRMNEEELLNHLLGRWSVTDQTLSQFDGSKEARLNGSICVYVCHTWQN